jgi:hypothetical protein
MHPYNRSLPYKTNVFRGATDVKSLISVFSRKEFFSRNTPDCSFGLCAPVFFRTLDCQFSGNTVGVQEKKQAKTLTHCRKFIQARGNRMLFIFAIRPKTSYFCQGRFVQLIFPSSWAGAARNRLIQFARSTRMFSTVERNEPLISVVPSLADIGGELVFANARLFLTMVCVKQKHVKERAHAFKDEL